MGLVSIRWARQYCLLDHALLLDMLCQWLLLVATPFEGVSEIHWVGFWGFYWVHKKTNSLWKSPHYAHVLLSHNGVIKLASYCTILVWRTMSQLDGLELNLENILGVTLNSQSTESYFLALWVPGNECFHPQITFWGLNIPPATLLDISKVLSSLATRPSETSSKYLCSNLIARIL